MKLTLFVRQRKYQITKKVVFFLFSAEGVLLETEPKTYAGHP